MRTDLLIQLLIMAIEEWITELSTRMVDVGEDPGGRLVVYIDATLRLFCRGSHGPLIAAVEQHPEAHADERVQKAHAEMEPMLRMLVGADLVGQLGASLEAVSRMLQRMARASLSTNPEGITFSWVDDHGNQYPSSDKWRARRCQAVLNTRLMLYRIRVEQV